MRCKYPKTWHFPWSESISSDDHWLTDCAHFDGKKVIVSEKMDGECTTVYNDYIHARSVDSQSHPCRTRIRRTWGAIRHEIPDGFRICGENMEAAHSLWYLNLEAHFYVFGIYDREVCLSWKETLEWLELLGLRHPPVFYEGIWDEQAIKNAWTGKSVYTTVVTPEDHIMPADPWACPPSTGEGYVVRVADEFSLADFALSLGKFVRKGHVTTPDYWMDLPVLPNLLR